jgi:hypothetical protein
MAACKEAQALAEAAYAKAPVPNLLINCVVETDADRERMKNNEERRRQGLITLLCRNKPKPCP